MVTINFDGQVAVVTGAGGGMGRAYAIELARRGAKVLVNDYGGTDDGIAGNLSRAQGVVDEITAEGGTAVANGEAVGSRSAAQRIIDHAVSAFGRVDILINNAGITALGGIAEVEFDRVEAMYQISLIGPHALTQAVWPIMKEQGYGRILNVTSNAAFGIGGNASYAAAKAGVIGLSLDAGFEGQRHGITVNAVMPVSYSRLIDRVPDSEFIEWMKANFTPELVARGILPLLSRDCTLTARVFAVGGGRVARIAFLSNNGYFSNSLTPENVLGSIDDIDDLNDHFVIERQSDEMSLWARFHPFARPGGPKLAEDALVKD